MLSLCICLCVYIHTACAFKSTSSVETVLSHVVSISPWLSEDVFVKGLLSAGQPAFEDVLVLLGQLLLHVPFGTPQDEGLDHLHLKVTNGLLLITMYAVVQNVRHRFLVG